MLMNGHCRASKSAFIGSTTRPWFSLQFCDQNKMKQQMIATHGHDTSHLKLPLSLWHKGVMVRACFYPTLGNQYAQIVCIFT